MSTTCAKRRAGCEPRERPRSWQLAKWLALAILGTACWSTATAEAQTTPRRRAIGLWPDIAFTIGGGIGIGHAIDTNIYGGLRLGALFAYEPWVINAGFAAEVGALPKRGLGAEFELNYVRGPFLQVAYDKIVGGDWMLRSMVGFALFGVQWQHRMGATKPDNALLFVLRLPLGIGWFFLHDQERRQHEPPPRRKLAEPHEG